MPAADPLQTPQTPQSLPQTFEAAMSELETLVADLESGRLPLASALAAYRRGALLLKFAQGQLESAQAEVRILEGEVLRNFGEGSGDAQ